MPGVWETEAEWYRLRQELDAWHEHRRHADAEGLHRTQLLTAYTLIQRVLAELHVPIAGIAGDDQQALAQCRVHDRRLAWVRRVWDFFRDRFDQRDQPALAPVLRAADEVVWSCHREPFAMTCHAGEAIEPPPLAYVEPGLTPEVFPHGLVPATLRRDVDAPFLRASLASLPFAVVRVPASCVTAPWWLVHLGHEVGHVVDERFLGYATRTSLVANLHLEARAADRWTQWSGEVFADLYAALMAGPWALWALAMAEANDPTTMLVARDSYPAPAVRLLLLAHACDVLGCTPAIIQDDVASWKALVAPHPDVLADLRDGVRVVDALLGQEVKGRPWTTLTAHDASRWTASSLQAWAGRLAQRPARVAGKGRRVWAREVIAAGVMRRKAGEALGRGFDGEGLASDLLEWLPAVREPGTRAARAEASPEAASHGMALARHLMEAEPLS